MSRFRWFSCRRTIAGIAVCAPILVISSLTPTPRAQQAAPGLDPVLREALVSGTPPAAPGQALQLVRYVIQPGATLPAHTHPGLQLGWLESGTLHYVVVAGGEVPVSRDGKTIRTLRPGEALDLRPGDAIAETDTVVHYGANRGEEPVVIWVAALLRQGQPPATIVEPPAP
jgi:quercetin dioxygenase-like cupin family protein